MRGFPKAYRIAHTQEGRDNPIPLAVSPQALREPDGLPAEALTLFLDPDEGHEGIFQHTKEGLSFLSCLVSWQDQEVVHSVQIKELIRGDPVRSSNPGDNRVFLRTDESVWEINLGPRNLGPDPEILSMFPRMKTRTRQRLWSRVMNDQAPDWLVSQVEQRKEEDR